MDFYKKLNLYFLIISLLAGFGSLKYWTDICSQHKCSHETIVGLLEPMEFGGYILALFSFIFLLLPSHYFQAWFKKIFSWAFPLSVILVAGTQDSGSVLSFSKATVVQILGVFFGVISAYFVLYRFLKLRKQTKG